MSRSVDCEKLAAITILLHGFYSLCGGANAISQRNACWQAAIADAVRVANVLSHETGAALGTLCCLARAHGRIGAARRYPAAPAPTFSFADLFAPSRTTLLGDAGGLRPALAKYGITFTLFEESEVFGNVSGGYKRGADYDGVTTPTVMLDTSKAFGWEGGTFEVSGFQIHGSNLSAKNLGVLQLVERP